MQQQSTALRGVQLIKPDVHEDERGFLKETFSQQRYQQLLGITDEFVQDNFSASKKGVLRGLHYQKNRPQGKLVMVAQGMVFDVVADINPTSPSYGQYVGIELRAENHWQLWVPPGYAHGFCVLSDTAQVLYKCTDYYQPDDQAGVIWNCPTLAIDWPIREPLLSPKDAILPPL